MDEELERFKAKIDLCEYAASKGYVVDLKKTTKKSSVMSRGSDQVVISIGEKGYYIYFKRGPKAIVDSGTIIDFVQAESNLNLGQARVELRKWLGWKNRPKINPANFRRVKQKSSVNEIALTRAFLELWDINDERSNVLSYLASRHIPESIVFHERISSTLRTDKYNNIIFPHFQGKTVIGWEIKNHNFTGFPEGSTKSVWFSNRYESDDTLILTEAGIEALSFFTLNPDYLKNAWILATAGGWGDESEQMMKLAFETYPEQKIILGFNNDEDGRKYDDAVISILKEMGDKRIPKVIKPESNDWNKDLSNKLNDQLKIPD
jgi:glutaredoxin 2